MGLHRRIILRDAAGDGGMRPKRDSLGAVKCISAGMVVVIVGVEGSLDGHLADHAQRIHLKRSAGRRGETLNQQSSILPDQEATVAYGSETLRWIGNRGVESISNFTYRREAFVDDGRLRDARVDGDRFGQVGQPDELRHAIEGPKARAVGDEFTSRKSMNWVDYH